MASLTKMRRSLILVSMSYIQSSHRLSARAYLAVSPPVVHCIIGAWKEFIHRLARYPHLSNNEMSLFQDHLDDIAGTLHHLEWRAFITLYIPPSCHDQFNSLLTARTCGVSEHSPQKGLVGFYVSTRRSVLDTLWHSARSRCIVRGRLFIRRMRLPIQGPILTAKKEIARI